MKLHEKIIRVLTTDVPELLKLSGLNGNKIQISATKWLEKGYAHLKPRTIRKIHNTYLIICYGALITTIPLIISNNHIAQKIGSLLFGIFLGSFTLMIISWIIFLDCPLTHLEEHNKKETETK